MLELPHLRVRCSRTDDIFFRALRVSSRCGLCSSYIKGRHQGWQIDIRWIRYFISNKEKSVAEEHACKILDSTFSRAFRVNSSIGNNWSLSFVEGCVLVSGTRCEITPRDVTGDTECAAICPSEKEQIVNIHKSRTWVSGPSFHELTNSWVRTIPCSDGCPLQLLSSISNQRNPSHCSLFPSSVGNRWESTWYTNTTLILNQYKNKERINCKMYQLIQGKRRKQKIDWKNNLHTRVEHRRL